MVRNIGVIGVMALLLGIAAMGIVAAYRQPKEETTTYSAADAERPQIKLSEQRFDLGQMDVRETREKQITVSNIGAKPLVLKNFGTSCDCTFAHMTIDGKESPHFTMHGMNAWSGTIEPGQSGTLTVIYDPSKMPVKGAVERAVLFETNDPGNPRVQVVFTAWVN